MNWRVLSKHQIRSARWVLVGAAAAQVLLLWLSDHLQYPSAMLVILILLACAYLLRERWAGDQPTRRSKSAEADQVSNSALVVLSVGGFGMLLGSTLDSIILGKDLCMVDGGLPMGLVYSHMHGIESISSYMVLFMLLFCLPSCVVFCSSNLDSKHQRFAELCGHAFAAVCMLLGMLYLPHLTQLLLGGLAEQFNYAVQLNQLFSSFLAQHSLMLISMLIGSLLGYQLFAYLPIQYRVDHQQI